MTLLSPSRLALEAAGRKPVGSHVATADMGACAMCGTTIGPGDIYSPFEVTNTFMDRPSLADPFSYLACGHCTVVRSEKEFLQRFSKSVVTRDGFFKIASNDDQASFFLNPPAPPFLAFVSDATQQHLIWRTPVSYSKDVFQLRFGNRVLMIRHKVMMRTLAAFNALHALLETHVSGGPTKFQMVGFDRELYGTRHGQFSTAPILLAAARPELEREIIDHVEQVHSASPGEYFAAARIFLSNLANTAPEDAPALTKTLGRSHP